MNGAGRGPRTALVLGGGGMFGAYEAGVWQVLEGVFQPDLIAGASIGALNGWAIAGGCPAGEWAEHWLDFPTGALPRLRVPRRPLDGIFDRAAFERVIRGVHSRFSPRVPITVAITDLSRMRPFAVDAPDIEWIHLAASCALFGFFPQYRIGGRLVTDGGLLASVPLWAAAARGATRIVAVNILPGGGPWWLRGARSLLHAVAPPLPALPAGVEVVWIEHARALGPARDAVVWSGRSAARLLELGRADALAAVPMVRRLTQTF
ncbi:MAG: patatin-like phospholipase family protein [Candidatus Solibacter usitatus]|nr:patatin-like phospholipase family protein [Candidatus Solibacter usitatus]